MAEPNRDPSACTLHFLVHNALRAKLPLQHIQCIRTMSTPLIKKNRVWICEQYCGAGWNPVLMEDLGMDAKKRFTPELAAENGCPCGPHANMTLFEFSAVLVATIQEYDGLVTLHVSFPWEMIARWTRSEIRFTGAEGPGGGNGKSTSTRWPSVEL